MQKYGELMHVHVDAMSPQGSVFVRCISAQIALNAVRGINTRSLAGALNTRDVNRAGPNAGRAGPGPIY